MSVLFPFLFTFLQPPEHLLLMCFPSAFSHLQPFLPFFSVLLPVSLFSNRLLAEVSHVNPPSLSPQSVVASPPAVLVSFFNLASSQSISTGPKSRASVVSSPSLFFSLPTNHAVRFPYSTMPVSQTPDRSTSLSQLRWQCPMNSALTTPLPTICAGFFLFIDPLLLTLIFHLWSHP